MRALYLLVMALFAAALSETTDSDLEVFQNETRTPQETVQRANNLFANQMYEILSRNGGNILFSPLSAHALLATLYQGMSGPIKDTFARTLHLPDVATTADGYSAVMETLNDDTRRQAVALNVANKIFIHSFKSLRPSYKETVETKFSAEIEQVDFSRPVAAAETINEWTRNKTMGKIKELFTVEELKGALIVLANSVYFKGSWCYRFKSNFTAEFTVDNETVVNASMISQMLTVDGKEDEELGAVVVDVPYSDREFSMLLFLPYDKAGVGELERKLLGREVGELTAGMTRRAVNVTLPRFKFKETVKLVEVLKKMGLGDLFNQSASHLSGIVENAENLYVSGAIQKVFIHVDKGGTEAGAVTAARSRTKSKISPIPPLQFRADHPFVFMLTHQELGRDRTVRDILFYGRIMRPNF